ncbi:hypothetical protein HMPREF0004_0520 [Achromobacter piechaudii ATCC 43553]|uniref:Uncharacterized protein n=1 Tax=Achromobacter piechaudii ATCC 43553 TaxID=742159 RepID=D4X4X3_9BURK|nr:hypothetical protein HMPREF0004_0520 [Achromobacter piechaudii ATCC 43553]
MFHAFLPLKGLAGGGSKEIKRGARQPIKKAMLEISIAFRGMA